MLNRHRRNIAILAFVTLIGGCTQSVDDPEPNTNVASSEELENVSEAVSGVAFGVQNVILSEDRYDRAVDYEHPDHELVRRVFEETDWNHPDLRPIFKLVRWGEPRIELIQVKRNPTEDGELHVGWSDVRDGQYTEAESTQIDSPDKLLELLLAFLNDDPELRNRIEWDYLDVRPID